MLFGVTTCRLRRAEAYIKRGTIWEEVSGVPSTNRRGGGRTDRDDSFRVLDDITGVKPPGFRAVRVGGFGVGTDGSDPPAATKASVNAAAASR
jgi:hypothetical protein